MTSLIELLPQIILGTLSIFIVVTVFVYLYIDTFKNDKQNTDKYAQFKIDKDTYDIVISHLEKIIKYEAIYTVNVFMGKAMSDTIGASFELTNDEIDQINQQVKVRVIECISEPIRKYFIDTFGEEWLLDYIKIYSTSMILGYSDLSITSLVYAKNNTNS